MPIEYAGYIPSSTRVNWEGLTDKFAEKTTNVIKARQGERQALDQIAIDNEKMINEQELTKTQTVSDFLIKSGFTAKYFNSNQNKELKAGRITPEEYRRSMNNLTSNWGVLASSAKTYDTKRQEILARQEVNKETGKIPASEFELELQRNYEEMLDMSNNKLHIANNGNVMLGKVDPKTGEIIGELQDVRSLNIPENILANRVDVNTSVKTFTDGWKANKIFKDLGHGGELTIEDIRQNAPEFDLAVNYLAKQISGTPRQALSLLIDNGPVTSANYFYKDEDRESLKAKAIAQLAKDKSEAGMSPPTQEELDAIDLSMIKLVKGADGVINPELTEKQNKAAIDRVRNEVEIQFPHKEDGKAKQDWYHAPATSNNDNDGWESGIKGMPRTYADYQMIDRAIATGNASVLNQNSIHGYIYRRNSNGSISVTVPKGAWFNGDLVTKDRDLGPVVNGIDLANDMIKSFKGYSGRDRYELMKGWHNEDNPEAIVSNDDRTFVANASYNWLPEKGKTTGPKTKLANAMVKNGISNTRWKEAVAIVEANPNTSFDVLMKRLKAGKTKQKSTSTVSGGKVR